MNNRYPHKYSLSVGHEAFLVTLYYVQALNGSRIEGGECQGTGLLYSKPQLFSVRNCVSHAFPNVISLGVHFRLRDYRRVPNGNMLSKTSESVCLQFNSNSTPIPIFPFPNSVPVFLEVHGSRHSGCTLPSLLSSSACHCVMLCSQIRYPVSAPLLQFLPFFFSNIVSSITEHSPVLVALLLIGGVTIAIIMVCVSVSAVLLPKAFLVFHPSHHNPPCLDDTLKLRNIRIW